MPNYRNEAYRRAILHKTCAIVAQIIYVAFYYSTYSYYTDRSTYSTFNTVV